MKRGLVAAIAYALLYIGGLAVLHRDPSFATSETLSVMFVLGLGLSVAAWLATLGASARAQRVSAPNHELLWIALLLAAIGVGFLGYGLSAVRAAVAAEPARMVAVLAAKLAALVCVPALVFRRLGYSWRQLFAFARLNRVELRALLVMMVLLALIQLTVGRGPQLIGALRAERGLAVWQLLLMVVPVWAWLSLEAGLTEEFLFRALVQARLTVWLRSPVAGLLGMSVLFGLAHAPGYVLRGAHAMEGMAQRPDALTAAAYALVVVSPLGLPFGVLWARTRSLTLVVVLHGWADVIPNLAPWFRALVS